MINAIRMEGYRMVHMRSFWVMTLVIISITFLSTWMDYQFMKTAEVSSETSEEMEASDTVMTLGIAVDVDEQSYDDISAVFLANVRGLAVAFLMVIFVVLFAGADYSSGYIKNIGGQMSHRSILIFSKSVAVFLWVLYCMLLFYGVQAIANGIIIGYLKWGDWKGSLSYVAIQILLHFALAQIVMMVTMVLRSITIGMAFAIMVTLGVSRMICSLFDRHIMHPYMNKSFDTYAHMVTGKISGFPIEFTSKEAASAILVAVVFIVLMAGANIFSTTKRDLV